MPRRDPASRALATAASRLLEPEHPFERELWRHLRSEPAAEPVERAYELYTDDSLTGRDGLRAWLLTPAKDEEVSSRMRLPLEVIKAFKHLFFDVTAFRDHFDLLSWVRSLHDHVSPEGLRCIQWAVMYGVESVAYLMGLESHLDPRLVQQQAMVQSHYQGLMGRDMPIDSMGAREALKHRQVAVNQAAVLAKAAPPSARDFAVKLKHRQLTTPIEVVDKTTEVLH